MRRLLALISVAGVAMALATSAQAGPFTGTVSFGLSTLPPLVASGSGSGGAVPGLLTIATPSWASTAATGAGRITLDPTAAAPLTALSILLVAPGPCTFTGAPLRGPCALGGTANALVGGAPFLIVPLGGLGVAGRVSFGPYGSWIDAQSWTAATATPTVAGSPVLDDYGVPFYTAGYDARTPGGAGTIKLVAPAGLMSTLGGDLPLFVSMTLFVPEPGTLLLLIFSSAGLVVAGGLSGWRSKESTRKRRALFSLLALLALGMVALWATSTLAGPFPPTSTTTTSTSTTPTSTTTTSTTTTPTTTTSTTTTVPPRVERVTICHRAGRSGLVRPMTLHPNAVPGHLAHGDFLAPPDPLGPYGCSYYGASIYPPQERGISLAASGLATVLMLAGVLGIRRRA